MTALAGAVGWSSHQTIGRVYDEAVSQIVAAQGKTAPPNPFDLQPTLSLLSNVSIYIAMIGALLAIVVGHLARRRRGSAGIGRLVLLASGRPPGTCRGQGGRGRRGARRWLSPPAWSSPRSPSALVNGALPSRRRAPASVLFYGLSWLYLVRVRA